jgi:histone H3/H4
MTGIIIKSKIRELVKKLDSEQSVTSVAEEVETELEKKVEDILKKGIERAKANQRRTLLARDL